MSGEPSTMGNNKIRNAGYLVNILDRKPFLERFFFALGPKILFQQHRPYPDITAMTSPLATCLFGAELFLDRDAENNPSKR